MTAVWLMALCAGGIQGAATIRSALSRAEIEVFPLDAVDAERQGNPGIVLFDRSSDSVRETIRELTLNGRRRVLAVATSLSGLVGGISAWDLLRAGAADVVAWDDPAVSARSIAARVERWREIDHIIASPEVRKHTVGQSSEWIGVLHRVIEAACFTQAPIVITGESGTGKEVIARLVHSLDRRPSKRDFVVLDCSTLVRELSGSEFFGHERGAFTGAISPREGAFALADSGTLFLDEVGELPPELQTQLLRVVQEHTFKRVGSNDWKRTNFRLVCATNRDLQQEVARGRFRTDLYYRIAGVYCHLPPLRERVADIPPLVRYFISELAGDRVVPGIDESALQWLSSREYRGNIRELRSIVARMLYRHTGPGPLSIGAFLRRIVAARRSIQKIGATRAFKTPSHAPSPAA